MFNSTNYNSRILPENEETEHNFDMSLSEYMPVANLIDSNYVWPFSERYSLEEGVKPNIYLKSLHSSYIHSTSNNYFNVVKGFNKQVNAFTETKSRVLLPEYSPRSFRSSLTKISYLKLRESVKFISNGIGYDFVNTTIGLIWEEAKNKTKVVYLLTFKTKYILELQRALIQGKPFKNIWFKLFIAPEIPGLMNKDKFKKPFANTFITPYEEKNIEIEYKENFIEDISFKVLPITGFTPLIGTRSVREETKKNLLSQFICTKQDQIKAQKNWDSGITSMGVAREQLREWRRDKLLLEYIAYIDAVYYKDIPLVEGLNRRLYFGDYVKKETYTEGEWEISSVSNKYAKNPLRMNFQCSISSFKEDKNPIVDISCVLDGRELIYAENRVFNLESGLDNYYVLNNFLATRKTFFEELPISFYTTNTSTLFLYDEINYIYRSQIRLETEYFYNVPNSPNLDVYVTGSTLYKPLLDTVTEPSFLYFVDENRIYYLAAKRLILMLDSPTLRINRLKGSPELVAIAQERILRETDKVGNVETSKVEWLWSPLPETAKEVDFENLHVIPTDPNAMTTYNIGSLPMDETTLSF